MANTPLKSASPSQPKKLKRNFSSTGIDSDEEEVKAKYVKISNDTEDGQFCNKILPSPLKKTVSDNTNATSPLADSGYEISVGNTPGSNKPWKFVQPGSSGYISDSDCGTPAVGQRTPGPFSPDFVSKGKRTIAPFSPGHLSTFIQRKFVLLKEEVDPSGIADILNADGIISNGAVEMIREEKYRVEKCDLLLKAISRSTLKNDIHTPRKVISAFQKEGYGHLVKDFDQEKVAVKQSLKEPLPSTEEIKGRLYINSSELEDEIDPILIIDDLVAEGVLSLDEHQDIKQTDFKPNKVKNLIKYLLRKSESDFCTFCKVLEKHYQPLAELLRQGASGPTAIDQSKPGVVDVTFIQKPIETHTNKDRQGANNGEKTEVKFCFVGNGQEEEKMIVDDNSSNVDFDFQEEAMEIGFEVFDIQFSSIRINLTSMSRQSQMELLKKCRESPHFLKKWIQKLITEKHIQQLKEKQLNKMTFEIKLCFPSLDERKCSCKLTKEVIVQHYSSLEGMKSVDKIIQTFGDFEGFDEATKSMFKDLLADKSAGNKTENFLRMFLDLPDTRLHLCLLEREMRKTNLQLLQKVIQVPPTDTEIKLTIGDIRRNMHYLVDELEPRHFMDMLTGLEGSESIVEKVMSTDPRKERCRELLNFIMQKRNTGIEMLVQELQRNNKCHIVEFLVASKKEEELTDLKEALVHNYKHIVDEIEPRIFRQTFVERREIKAKEFDVICKLSTRRQRAIMLMKTVIKGKGSVWKCFTDALEISGYRHLVNLIDSDMKLYKDCPRLYQSQFGAQDVLHLDGELHLEFKQGDVKESALQVFLHKMIYVSDSKEKQKLAKMTEPEKDEDEQEYLSADTKAKRMRTSEWIKLQQICRKRERNDFDETDTSSGSKHVCPEVAFAVRDHSPASSPTFGMARQDDLADYCSSARLTRSTSRGSDEKPLYEDISPPASPSPDRRNKPHTIIEAPCSPLGMFGLKRRNSLSDGTSHTSSVPASPHSCMDTYVIRPPTEPESFRARASRSWSIMRSSFNVETFFENVLKGKFKSAEF